MAVDLIRYDLLVQEALRGAVGKVLSDVARDGIPGEHHFYISFRTHARGVRLSARMRKLYPDELIVVLQHQFWDLSVTGEAFEVGLSFQNIPEMVLVPFDAVTRFADPSVGFELRFAVEDAAADAEEPELLPPHTPRRELEPLAEAPPLPETKPAKQTKKTSDALNAEAAEAAARQDKAKVVSIDTFRKKS